MGSGTAAAVQFVVLASFAIIAAIVIDVMGSVRASAEYDLDRTDRSPDGPARKARLHGSAGETIYRVVEPMVGSETDDYLLDIVKDE